MNGSNRRSFLHQSFTGALLVAPSLQGLIERVRLADANAKAAALPPLPNGVSEATRDALRSPAPVTAMTTFLPTVVR